MSVAIGAGTHSSAKRSIAATSPVLKISGLWPLTWISDCGRTTTPLHHFVMPFERLIRSRRLDLPFILNFFGDTTTYFDVKDSSCVVSAIVRV